MAKVEKVDVFKCRSVDRWDYANFVVVQRYDSEDPTVGYFMLAIESSYGNGYAFAWTHPGACFYTFLANQLADPWYVASKMCQGDPREIDWDATLREVRKRIVDLRRRQECTADEARAAWPDSFEDGEYAFWSWARDQDLLRAVHEDIHQVPGHRYRQFMGLHKAFWSDFAKQLTEATARGAA